MDQSKVYSELEQYRSQLIWPLSSQDRLVQHQLQLMLRHRPAWLLPVSLRYRDGLPQLCLDVTSFKPLDLSFEPDQLKPERGKAILREMLDYLSQAADMLLPINQFSLEPSHIFVKQQVSGRYSLMLAFWPAANSANADVGCQQHLVKIGQAFGLTVSDIDNLYESCSLSGQPTVVDDLEKISGASVFSEHFKPRVFYINHKPVIVIVMHVFVAVLAIVGILTSQQWPFDVRLLIMPLVTLLFIFDIRRSIKAGVFCKLLERFKALFEQLTLWLNARGQQTSVSRDNQTVLLVPDPADFRIALLSQGKPGTSEENEGLRAFILIDEFIIGREQKTCDLCLTSQGIGRQHARITRRAGSFFICDLGSRNGTRLDGRKLIKNEESLLPDQCMIEFADLPFYFQVD